MEDDPEYDIVVAPVSGNAPRCETRLREAIQSTLRRHSAPAARISVAVVDDAHIARLNQLYLNQEGATDVLAFDLGDDELGPSRDRQGAVFNPRGCRRRPKTHGSQSPGFGPAGYLSVEGEIVVSADTAAREARGRGHSFEAELALYAVHGTLHLLGYDDDNEQAAARMHELEDEILGAIGVGAVYRTNRQSTIDNEREGHAD